MDAPKCTFCRCIWISAVSDTSLTHIDTYRSLLVCICLEHRQSTDVLFVIIVIRWHIIKCHDLNQEAYRIDPDSLVQPGLLARIGTSGIVQLIQEFFKNKSHATACYKGWRFPQVLAALTRKVCRLLYSACFLTDCTSAHASYSTCILAHSVSIKTMNYWALVGCWLDFIFF